MKCFLCGKQVDSEEELLKHIEEEHQDVLTDQELRPEDMTAQQLLYHQKNKKHKNMKVGICPMCSKLKPWDEEKKKYKHYCGSQECADKYTQIRINNTMAKHGVENPADVEENQYAMMEGKGKTMYALSNLEYIVVDKNNTDDPKVVHELETKYKDATKYVFLSKVEEKTILGLMTFFKPSDIQAPMMNAKIEYTIPHDPTVHKHLPDIFVPSVNLIVSCKDSILHPNMHPNMKKDRYKNLYEYQYILNHTSYNYIQIEGEEDVANLTTYINAVKKTTAGGGRYVSPPKVDIYVLMQEQSTGFDENDFLLDTFVINGQGFVFRNRNSSNGFRYKDGILECIEVEKFDNVVYDMAAITDIIFGESLEVYTTNTDLIQQISERFTYMEFEEMVDFLEDFEVLVTDGDSFENYN